MPSTQSEDCEMRCFAFTHIGIHSSSRVSPWNKDACLVLVHCCMWKAAGNTDSILRIVGEEALVYSIQGRSCFWLWWNKYSHLYKERLSVERGTTVIYAQWERLGIIREVRPLYTWATLLTRTEQTFEVSDYHSHLQLFPGWACDLSEQEAWFSGSRKDSREG